MPKYYVFVNSKTAPYTELILAQLKSIETRTRNTLKSLIGKRVGIIETGKGAARIVGYVTITKAEFCPAEKLEEYRDKTRIPYGDKYNKCGTHAGQPGKWFYYLEEPERCTPFVIPSNAVRHGRVYVEF